ncbi:hypothetical protein [Streptomyces sp. MNP-20]|uniref:hypothetical protein n=1 Tax=Streptomyces sp. MNP-20 TaxID=2721165 RepID=UPI001551A9D6|nr:hypothetical protein [Streptomyces sp. MNP-20]
MIILYEPEGGEIERLDAGRLRASEIQIIERTADRPWVELKEAMSEGDIGALRVIAWAIKRRSEPSLRLADFDPWDGELRARLDARETRSYADWIVAKYGDDPGDLAAACAELREASADAEACELAIKEAQAPKDPAPSPVPEQSSLATGS